MYGARRPARRSHHHGTVCLILKGKVILAFSSRKNSFGYRWKRLTTQP